MKLPSLRPSYQVVHEIRIVTEGERTDVDPDCDKRMISFPEGQKQIVVCWPCGDVVEA